MRANEIKKLLHKALVLLDEMDSEPETLVKPTPTSYGLDAISTQPVVLPNPEPSVVEPPVSPIEYYNWDALRVLQQQLGEEPSSEGTEMPPSPAQQAAQDALAEVKREVLATESLEELRHPALCRVDNPAGIRGANDFNDIKKYNTVADLAATLPSDHPLSAIIPPAEAPKQRKRKAASVENPVPTVETTPVSTAVIENPPVPVQANPAVPTQVNPALAQTPEQNLTPAAPTALPAQAVEPPKVEKLLNPEQEKEIKEHLAKYRNEILPAGGMVPVDKIGGVEIQLRKYVAQFCSTKPSSKTWAYDDWKIFVGVLDNMVATVGPAGLVQHIQKAIGILK